jgi:hypothetical protein
MMSTNQLRQAEQADEQETILSQVVEYCTKNKIFNKVTQSIIPHGELRLGFLTEIEGQHLAHLAGLQVKYNILNY